MTLGRLHVGLVEGIEGEHVAGHRRGELPEKELRPDVVDVVEEDADHRVPRLAQPAEIGHGRLFAVEDRTDEHAIGAVHVHAARGLGDDGHDAPAFLAGTLGDELFRPVPEPGDPLRKEEGQLVPPGQAQDPQGRAKLGAVVGAQERDIGLPAGVGHGDGALEEPRCVDAEERPGHEAEDRERRETSPDGRFSREHLPERASQSRFVQGVAGIGDGDEVLPGLLAPEDGRGATVEVLEERERLHGGARFGGHDEEGPGRVDVPGQGCDGGRVGAVEDSQAQESLPCPEGGAQDLGRKGRAPHAKEQGTGVPC